MATEHLASTLPADVAQDAPAPGTPRRTPIVGPDETSPGEEDMHSQAPLSVDDLAGQLDVFQILSTSLEARIKTLENATLDHRIASLEARNVDLQDTVDKMRIELNAAKNGLAGGVGLRHLAGENAGPGSSERYEWTLEASPEEKALLAAADSWLVEDEAGAVAIEHHGADGQVSPAATASGEPVSVACNAGCGACTAHSSMGVLEAGAGGDTCSGRSTAAAAPASDAAADCARGSSAAAAGSATSVSPQSSTGTVGAAGSVAGGSSAPAVDSSTMNVAADCRSGAIVPAASTCAAASTNTASVVDASLVEAASEAASQASAASSAASAAASQAIAASSAASKCATAAKSVVSSSEAASKAAKVSAVAAKKSMENAKMASSNASESRSAAKASEMAAKSAETKAKSAETKAAAVEAKVDQIEASAEERVLAAESRAVQMQEAVSGLREQHSAHATELNRLGGALITLGTESKAAESAMAEALKLIQGQLATKAWRDELNSTVGRAKEAALDAQARACACLPCLNA